MKTEHIDTLRQRLLNTRQALISRIAEQRGGKLGRAEAASEQFDPNDVDRAENLSVRDLALAIDEHESVELNAVQAALVRVREGSYGDCIDCGQAIGLPRLEASPEVERCIHCQTEWERQRLT